MTTVRVSIADRQVFVSSHPLRLTPQFFQLYCYLAYARARGRQGFVSCQDIHQLSRWTGCTLSSIGKQVRRHVSQRSGQEWRLIESPVGAAAKLFRLGSDSDDVLFDRPLPEVRAFLGLDLPSPALAPGEFRRAVLFSARLISSYLEAQRGRLREARAFLKEAERIRPESNREKVNLLWLWAELLSLEGEFQQASDMAEDAVRLCSQGGADYLTTARVHMWLGNFYAWMSNASDPSKAKQHLLRAHQLLEGSQHHAELATIAGAFGNLARLDRDWALARSYLLTAVEYSAAGKWFWGMQLWLYCLGLTEAERSPHLLEETARRQALLDAQEWLETAIRFKEMTGLGFDMSEAESLLSDVSLMLGKATTAMRWAQTALERARSAGNKKSEALALASLGEVQAAAGAYALATKSLRAALVLSDRLGLQQVLQRVRGRLDWIGTPEGAGEPERRGVSRQRRSLPVPTEVPRAY